MLRIVDNIIADYFFLSLFCPQRIQEDQQVSIGNLKSKGKIIIDYRRPSYQKRLWLMDGKEVLLNTYVAHGKNSGLIFARYFSNTENSLNPVWDDF